MENIMKKSILFLTLIMLSGCSMMKYLPKKHDSGLAYHFSQTVVYVEQLKCENMIPGDWIAAQLYAREFGVYAELRDDPQQDNIKAISENIAKAAEKSSTCPAYLKVVKLRLQVVAKALRGRK